MIIKMMSESKKTIAQMMVMRSRFFSTMLVPETELYMELAIISEMPVPLPEWSKMKITKPTPDTTSKTRKMITKAFKMICLSVT